MNITMITAVFPPYSGGMGNVAFEYAEAAGRAGHNVTVLAPKYKKTEPKKSIHFTTISLAPLLTFGNAALVRTFDGLIPEDTDLIHAHYPCIGFVGALKRWHKKHPNVPILITYHMDLVASGWKGLFFKWYTKCALPMMVSCAKKVHVTSFDYARYSVLSHYQKIEETIEIPLGVDTTFFHPTNSSIELFSSFGIFPHEKILLFVGALDSAHRFKGVPLLLRVFIPFSKTTKLVIIGTGNLKQKYEGIAREFGISDRVIFTGFVEQKDLPHWYSRAYVSILPSTSSSEAFGKVLLEAQSCGTPVIASDLPGVRGVVDDASGIRIKPNDVNSLESAITKMLSLPDETHVIARSKCREFVVQKFDQENIPNAVLELYSFFRQ